MPQISSGLGSNIEIVWDGAEYLMAWTFRGLIRGMRLGYDGTPIDLVPFDVPTDSSATHLALTTTRDGFVIAYGRADSTNGGAERAFVRTLTRLPEAPRRRVAGR
jgi:hypothetical protein